MRGYEVTTVNIEIVALCVIIFFVVVADITQCVASWIIAVLGSMLHSYDRKRGSVSSWAFCIV